MDPQKTSSPSSDSDKPKEPTTGSSETHEDPKLWGDSHQDDKPVTDDKPADDTSSADGDKPADSASDDAPKDDKIAINNWTDSASSDSSSDATDDSADKPATDPKPEAPISAPVAPAAEVTAAMPAAPAPAEPAPAIPSWPGTPASASPSMPASAVMGGTPSTKSKKGLLIGLVIALVVLVLGGGAAAAYFGYVVPNKPENVLKTALVNGFAQNKVDSEHFNGKVSVTDKTSNMTLSGTFNGGSTAKGAFDMTADIDAVVTKVKLDVRSVDGDTVYLRVGGLNGLPELLNAYGGGTATSSSEMAAYASIIGILNNQWIEINQSILSQLGAADMGSFKITDADRTKIGNAYEAHQFLTVQEKLGDEKISDMASYHYKVAINKAELKDFMVAVKDAKLDSIKLTQDDITQFNDAVKNIDFTKYPVDVWVSKDKKLIDQVSFSYSNKDVALSARATIIDYKPVTVTKPEGAKSLLEIISQMYSGQLNDATLMQELQSNGISL
jgi:hypothetical protein